jgi:hypothetical protein
MTQLTCIQFANANFEEVEEFCEVPEGSSEMVRGRLVITPKGSREPLEVFRGFWIVLRGNGFHVEEHKPTGAIEYKPRRR